jgi:hypothetical protein
LIRELRDLRLAIGEGMAFWAGAEDLAAKKRKKRKKKPADWTKFRQVAADFTTHGFYGNIVNKYCQSMNLS